nr:LOW QUALITY PROTEIN: transmembrane protease serine 12-like [Nothobranchius furzeri]
MQYMVSLQSNSGHECGGFLISEEFVVTAAHCSDHAALQHVRLGHHDLKEAKSISIEYTCKFPAYWSVGHDDDIMLVKLAERAPLNSKTKTIPLPNSATNLKENQTCSVAGWGKTETHRYGVTELRVVSVSIIDPPICQEMWGNDLPRNVICAGGFGTKKGFCQGDSGGPLVCNGEAVGVVSSNRHDNCDYPDVPNVYTDLSKYLPWIHNVLRENNFSNLTKRLQHVGNFPEATMVQKQEDVVFKNYKSRRAEAPLMKTMAVSVILLLLSALNGAYGSHIVGGKDAAPHSLPFMASLQVDGQHFCGGVLIREDFVLTAAHCQLPVSHTVVLGIDSLSGDESSKQEIPVLRSIPHSNFSQLENDIMLLKLSGRARLTEAVKLIPLRSSRLTTGSRCITAGWGDIGDNETLANRLQELNVTVLSQRSCQRRWREVPIAASMVCAIGNRRNEGFCSGDSGGPLVCDGASTGIVSFSGRQCGSTRTPDVYTRVSSFTDWIRSVLTNN